MKSAGKKQGVITYLKPYMKGKYILLIAATISLIAISIFNIVRIYFVEKVVAHLEAGTWNTGKMMPLIIALISSIIAGIIASYFSSYSIRKFSIYIVNGMRKKMYEKVLYASEENIQVRHSGNIISMFSNELTQIENFINNQMQNIVYYPIIFFAGVIYMLTINVKLTIVSVIVIPIFLLIAKKISSQLQQYSKNSYEALEKSNEKAHDYIKGVDTVKAYNIGDSILEEYKKSIYDYGSWQKKSYKVNSILLPFIILTWELPVIICIIFGGFLCLKMNEMTVAGLIAFVQLLGNIIAPLANFPDLIGNYMKTKGAIIRVCDLDKMDRECQHNKENLKYKQLSCKNIVEFCNVSFSYPNGKKVLDNVSFVVPKDKVIGIIGPSGCGKSTILALIFGFYTNYEGSIKILGKEMRDWNIEELRKCLSAEFRDDHMFSDTIYNNIGFGKIQAKKSEIIEAAKRANAYDFIMRNEQGFSTLIGSGGVQLSGGEMQRVAFARAILKQSKLLLLDEPTAALDKDSENALMKYIYEGSLKRTTIIVTHRLQTIEEADIIYTLSEGRIIEQGNHDELMKNQKLYYQFYMKENQKAVI